MTILPRLVLLCGLFAASLPVIAGPPDFPAPPDAEVSSAGDAMVINGRRTEVRVFNAPLAVDDVLLFYRELWAEPVARGGPPFAAEDVAMAPWRLLTRVEDGFVMTVQVQPGKAGAWGYLAVSKLPESGVGEKLPNPPAPHDSELLSNIAHEDPGQRARTAVLHNDLPVRSNVAWYRQFFAGWREDVDRSLSQDQLHTLSFTRGRRTVTVVIRGDDSQSEIVINDVRKDLLR